MLLSKPMKSTIRAAALILLAALTVTVSGLLGSAAARAQPAGGGLSPITSNNSAAAAISTVPAGSQARGGPDAVSDTPIPGMVEVRRGADIVYMSRDGKYVFTGELYQVGNHVDLTEVHRRELRERLIDALPESQMLVFGPKNSKYTVTVFTDVDCVYCRALHGQIEDYNRLGIQVRYVFFPRTGPNTSSWYKAEQVWCSSDRHEALTRAKLGEPLSAKVCAANPVAREYALGQAIGLQGTPGIVASNGALVGGYLPPAALLAALKSSEQSPTAGPND